jgi:hypothetical protein
MSSESKSSQENSNGAKTKRRKKKNPEEYFGSEVDLKLRGLLNPAESADLPATLPHQKVSFATKATKDATEAEAIKVLLFNFGFNSLLN